MAGDVTMDELKAARRRAAVARAQAQEKYWQAAGNYVASYGFGLPTRLDTPWPRGDRYVGEVRVEDEDLASLRDRACFLEKDNWLASGVLDRAVENVVGANIQVEPRTPNRQFNAQVKALLKKWMGTTACDIRGENTFGMLLQLLQRGKYRDGEGGVLLTYRVDADGRRLPRLQIIEPHRIESPPWARYPALAGGKQITDGVELNAQGAAVAYWVRYTDAARQVQYRRIPARDLKILKRRARYSSVRGTTAFEGGFKLFDQLAGVLEAVVVSWRVGASQAMIARRKNPGAVLAAMRQLNVTNPDVGAAESQRWYPIQPGGINVLGLDEELTPFNPSQPQQNFTEALRAFCRILGTRFGTTLEQVLLDFSQTTYSSGKMALNQAKTTAGIEQDALASLIITPVYQWWISLMIEGGDLVVPEDVDDAWAHEWIPPARISPEPMKDMQARKLALELGLDCRSNMTLEDGYDFGEIVEQNRKDRQMLAENGLPVAEDAAGGGPVTVNEDGTLSAPSPRSASAAPAAGGGNGTDGAGAAGADAPLNGAQITAAIDVLAKSREGALSDPAAIELLVKIGFERGRALPTFPRFSHTPQVCSDIPNIAAASGRVTNPGGGNGGGCLNASTNRRSSSTG